MSFSSQTGAPFWFPDSVILAALLLSRPRIWWAYLIAPLPIRIFVAVPPDLPIWFLLLAFANDSLKGLLAAWLVRWAVSGRELRFDALRDLWKYWVAGVLLAPAISGVAGAAAWHALGREFWPVWRQWFLGDAIANLVCTPLLLFLARDWRTLVGARPLRYAEGLLLFSLFPLAARFANQQGLGNAGLVDPLGYVPVPLLVWAAIRFGPAGASATLSVMSALSVAAAAGQPAVPVLGSTDRTLSIQLFMVVLAVPVTALAVLVEQQRRTEEALRESEERFRNMADSAPVLIWTSGQDGRATFFNRGWLDFTGRAVGQELGSGWMEGLKPDQLDGYLNRTSAACARRQSFRMEYQLRRADGQYRWILSSGAPRFTQGGAIAGYIFSCVDITDLKHAQEEALARHKLESLGVLTGGIAHDFNNLLGGIHALAELASAELATGSPPGEEIERIQAVASRGSEIVRELMIYSGQDDASIELLDISRLVEDTMELLKVSISKHAVLRTDLQPELPPVLGSAARIRQVVMNLVLNASEALGEKDGLITVATSCVMADGSTAGDRLRLVVSDTGCGMSEEAKARIFDPFFSTKFAGRGMGLAVVQGVVRDLGGSIQVSSTPGQGTRFEIFLPCGETAAFPTVPDARASAAQEPPPKTVLVVEDEDALRLAVSSMLRRRGFWVIEATDGAAALKQIRAHKDQIDAMLLDLTLPGVPSREVLEQARGALPNLKVILTSAYGREAVDASLAGMPVERFIRKPFQFVDLIGLLQDTLPVREAGAS